MKKRYYWRVLAPKWAFQPLSGEGAVRFGGRFNPKGMPSIYLSESLETAHAEYSQTVEVRPGTFCAYAIAGGRIADLIASPELAEGVDLACDWRTLALRKNKVPPTWTMVERLMASGKHGARMPSVRYKGGVNIVLWSWNDKGAPRLLAFDPNKDLPLDPSSWSKGRT